MPIYSEVVYHLVPTSNHNRYRRYRIQKRVVYHLVPTSNHNDPELDKMDGGLFIILFLHQTTTENIKKRRGAALFIILFLHQTTTGRQEMPIFASCLSSCSYIKPQPIVVNLLVISKILRFGLLRNGRAGRFLLQIY